MTDVWHVTHSNRSFLPGRDGEVHHCRERRAARRRRGPACRRRGHRHPDPGPAQVLRPQQVLIVPVARRLPGRELRDHRRGRRDAGQRIRWRTVDRAGAQQDQRGQRDTHARIRRGTAARGLRRPDHRARPGRGVPRHAQRHGQRDGGRRRDVHLAAGHHPRRSPHAGGAGEFRAGAKARSPGHVRRGEHGPGGNARRDGEQARRADLSVTRHSHPALLRRGGRAGQ